PKQPAEVRELRVDFAAEALLERRLDIAGESELLEARGELSIDRTRTAVGADRREGGDANCGENRGAAHRTRFYAGARSGNGNALMKRLASDLSPSIFKSPGNFWPA